MCFVKYMFYHIAVCKNLLLIKKNRDFLTLLIADINKKITVYWRESLV